MNAALQPSEACAYCGLPVPRPWWGRAADATAPAESFCCFGCRFAAAVTRARGVPGQINWTLTRLGLAIFFTMNVMVFTMALWTQDFYGPGPGDSAAWMIGLRGLFRYLCLLFALPVLFLLGGPLLDNACEGLRHGRWSTDLLLVLGVTASYVYSALSLLQDEGAVYFEIGCMVLVLVTLGRWLEAVGKLKTTETIEALARLLPDSVRVLRDAAEVQVPLDDVKVGDRLRVLPGERIPCDGWIVQSPTTVDEQVLTGESEAVVKEVGDPVFGGTLNLDGDVVIEVTNPARSGPLARLIELVRAALHSGGQFERLADRVSSWFLPAVVLIALGAFAWHTWQHGIDEGILTGLAVVLIACPCALGLATPLAVWTALGRAARAQVLFRNGDSLERLAGIRAILFDKTGTLTTGRSTVTEFVVGEHADRTAVLRQTARLTAATTHPYALAMRRFAEAAQEGKLPAESNGLEVRALPGRGITARDPADNRRLYLGSPRLMQEMNLSSHGSLASFMAQQLEAGRSLTCVGWDGRVQAVFAFQEQLRPEAGPAIARLQGQGLHVTVLTGDHPARGAILERELAIPVSAGLLPEDKVAALDRVRHAVGPTAMVGDGINDAPALAHSDVGIALGCGADVSRDAAAVCLLGDDLRRLPWAITLARQTVRVIRQNLFWAFAYNVIGIGIACTGRLNPVLASLAMVGSSFLVVANSLRLNKESP